MAGSLEGYGGTTQATYQFGLDWWIRALSGWGDHLSTASPFPQEGRSQAVAATVKFLEYKATLSERSRAMLTAQYDEAIARNKVVVFVRDDETRRLTSMSFDYE
jgi:hypothetical protein